MNAIIAIALGMALFFIGALSNEAYRIWREPPKVKPKSRSVVYDSVPGVRHVVIEQRDEAETWYEQAERTA